jgi:hypothetical protein
MTSLGVNSGIKTPHTPESRLFACPIQTLFHHSPLTSPNNSMASSLPPRPKPWEEKGASGSSNAVAGPSSSTNNQNLSSAFDNAVASSSSTAPRIPDRPSNLDGTMTTSGEYRSSSYLSADCQATAEQTRIRRLDSVSSLMECLRMEEEGWDMAVE